jgi:transcriptional regulatory protein RtcR
MPALIERREDIEPNLDYEMNRFAEKTGKKIRFNREAKELFLSLATGRDALWRGNFRDLSAGVTRMGILAEESRITTDIVREEWARLEDGWKNFLGKNARSGEDDARLLQFVMGEKAENLDRFDAVQLACVIRECRNSRSLSDAGRRLFAMSRLQKSNSNDADRLRKYLGKFSLSWEDILRLSTSDYPSSL